jgi:hypothetical protein
VIVTELPRRLHLQSQFSAAEIDFWLSQRNPAPRIESGMPGTRQDAREPPPLQAWEDSRPPPPPPPASDRSGSCGGQRRSCGSDFRCSKPGSPPATCFLVYPSQRLSSRWRLSSLADCLSQLNGSAEQKFNRNHS